MPTKIGIPPKRKITAVASGINVTTKDITLHIKNTIAETRTYGFYRKKSTGYIRLLPLTVRYRTDIRVFVYRLNGNFNHDELVWFVQIACLVRLYILNRNQNGAVTFT